MKMGRSLTNSTREATNWAELPSDEYLVEASLSLAGETLSAKVAFRALVIRHGPMVLGVCRQLLDRDDWVELAFQRTFRALAGKLGMLTHQDRHILSHWLYVASHHVAEQSLLGLNEISERRRKPLQLKPMTIVSLGREPGWEALKPVLHEEIRRLPDRFRIPTVLSCLEGRTREEIGHLLHWSPSTVDARLDQARAQLCRRLAFRGLPRAASFLAASFSQNVVFGEVVPTRLIDQTMKHALRVSKLTRSAHESSGSRLRSSPTHIHQIISCTMLVLVSLIVLLVPLLLRP